MSSQAPAEPWVAIDNVCAWPNITLLPDGTAVALVFSGQAHGNAIGDVECWASTDRGRTWRKRGVAANHDPENSNRMNIAAGLARNGDLMVISSGWLLDVSDRDAASSRRGIGLVRVLAPWVCRSRDGGHTWTTDREALPATSPAGEPPIPYGRIHAGSRGLLHVAAYARLPSPKDNPKQVVRQAYIYRSADDGKTWGCPVAIDPRASLSETALIHLGDGRWLAAARAGGLFMYESLDDGEHWRFSMRLPVDGYPGDFIRLRNGDLLLAYGSRSGTDRWLKLIRSRDEGRSWGDEIRLTDYRHDGGYPSSIEFPNGEVLTVFYAKESHYHTRYHMGALLWRPAETFPR